MRYLPPMDSNDTTNAEASSSAASRALEGESSHTWTISSTTKPHDSVSAADFCEAYASALRLPPLGDTLIRSVCAPFGALDCKQLRAIPRPSVVDAVVEAKFDRMIVGNIESKLFSPGKGFDDEHHGAADVEGQQPNDARGGYKVLKFTLLDADPKERNTATKLLGGLEALQMLNFPRRTHAVLRKLLCGGAKPNTSPALNVVFQFWIVAFSAVYIDPFARVKAGYMMHAINTTIAPEKWSSQIAVAFNNRRQGRYNRPLAFHADDASVELVKTLNMMGIASKEITLCHTVLVSFHVHTRKSMHVCDRVAVSSDCVPCASD